MRKYLLLIVLLVIMIIGYNYVYKEHRNIQSESPEHILTSAALISTFNSNISQAEKKYLNKTLEVSGIVSEINNNSLTLNGKIFCQFQNQIKKHIILKDSIVIKGRCIGYDALLEEIKLDQCISK